MLKKQLLPISKKTLYIASATKVKQVFKNRSRKKGFVSLTTSFFVTNQLF
jgi:hypothetical protein